MDESAWSREPQASRWWSLVSSFLASLVAVVLVCAFCPPIWETNDDVAMAMTAHGYGIAAVGTPIIIFSNVLWGHLVRGIPTLGGIDGYSIATLCVLVIVGATSIFALLHFRSGIIACAAIVSMALLRAVLFPQFTVNAGLLVVAAVVCWQIYAKNGEKGALIAGYFLAYLGYLVRPQEFALVLLVAVPVLPWRALLSHKTGQLTVAFFAVALISRT